MIVNKYANGGGGSTSGVTPQDVQQQINSALTPYWESGETKNYVDSAVSGISLDGYYTSAQTEEAIAEAVEGYATSGDMQSAFTLISETQQVAAAGLNQLEERIDELSGSSVDLSAYYTSAQTEDAISAATSGKADAANVTANNGSQKFPKWNKDGIITGEVSQAYFSSYYYINGVRREPLFNRAADASARINIYAPVSAGTAGDILVSTGNGAPVWSAVTFPDASNYVTSAQVETQIEAKNYVNSGDVKSQVEAYNYATVSQIPTVPTSNTAFTNDAGYITSAAIADKVSSTSVSTIWKGTQADYDDIPTKDPNTFYIIL